MGIFGLIVVVIAAAWMIDGIIWAMKTGKEQVVWSPGDFVSTVGLDEKQIT